tara:strand:+ start:523 stop:1734 length:1212 start_codon:yes stop_codon:yes gene_type:complete
MGGIGPIELSDVGRLSRLTERSNNGVPFYSGRFYPKNHTKFWDGFKPGIISQTPPWVTWEEIEDTQIWMISAFEGEKIVSTQTSIDRIDLWPRMEEDDLPVWEQTGYDQEAQERGWGNINPLNHAWAQTGSIDPGINIIQNFTGGGLNPIQLTLAKIGALGITRVNGHCSEYAFYDQELRFANGMFYGQPNMQVDAARFVDWDKDGNPTPPLEDYKELLRLREDGPWMYRNAELPAQGKLEFANNVNGYPQQPYVQNDGGEWASNQTTYNEWVNTDISKASTYGNDKWDEYTKYVVDGTDVAPKMGQVLGIKPSELDTVVYTIKTACQTVWLPPSGYWSNEQQGELSKYTGFGLANFGSYLTNQVWYFYLPVRYNSKYIPDRTDFLLNRAGLKRNDDPLYIAP